MIETRCAQCGAALYRQPYQVARCAMFFCSNVCAGQYRRDRVTLKCAYCGILFEKARSRRGVVWFCSRECRDDCKRIGYVNHFGYLAHTRNGETVVLHRSILEKALGRKLRSDEIVHHINGNKTDNRSTNLAIMTRSEHAYHHKPRRWDIDVAMYLRQSGLTFKQIGTLLSIDTTTVHRALRKLLT